MLIIFLTLLVFFIIINVSKILFSVLYIKKNPLKITDFDETKFSIVQPIISGDITLKDNLLFNLENTRNAHFVWLLDEGDDLAYTTCSEIVNSKEQYKSRVDIVVVNDIPKDCNQKTYKMFKGVDYAREYFVAADDDVKLTYEMISKTIEELNKNDKLFVTIYPYYKGSFGFFSKLVSTFVNSNSLFLYLGVSYVSPLKMLNGMFFVSKTNNFKNPNIFEQVLFYLSDELALAEVLKNKGCDIKLLPIPLQGTTTVPSLKNYLDLMKKWMIFFNHYMKQDLSPKVILIGLLPALTPLLLLIISSLISIKYFILFIVIHFMKSYSNRITRSLILKTKESFFLLFIEMITDYIQIIHILNAAIFPNTVVWRGKKIKLAGNKLCYED